MKSIVTRSTYTSRKSGLLSALTGLALLTVAGSPAWAAGVGNVGNPNILPPASSPNDLTYAQWAARYWQWSLSFPATANPAADTAPQESNQSGPVWFLASVTGNRTVTRQMTIPAGTFLFFPALSVYYNNADCPENTDFTKEELLEQAYVNSSFLNVMSYHQEDQLLPEQMDIWTKHANGARLFACNERTWFVAIGGSDGASGAEPGEALETLTEGLARVSSPNDVVVLWRGSYLTPTGGILSKPCTLTATRGLAVLTRP